MGNWEYELAKELKKDRRKPMTGVSIGTVVSVDPFQVQIQSGNFILDKKNTYICKQLLERKSKAVLKGTYEKGDITIDGNIELAEVWHVGDNVLVVPSSDGQKFFIIDVIREVS